MSVQNILGANGKIAPSYISGGPSYGFVENPMVDDLECASFEIKNASYVRTNVVECETLEPKAPQTYIEANGDLQMATGTEIRTEEIATNIVSALSGLLTLSGTSYKIDGLPDGTATPMGNVIGYNTSTGALQFQPDGMGPGGVASVIGIAPIASSGGANPNISLNTLGTASTYAYPTSITTDAYGRISAITAGSAPTVEDLATTLTAGNSAGGNDINMNNNDVQGISTTYTSFIQPNITLGNNDTTINVGTAGRLIATQSNTAGINTPLLTLANTDNTGGANNPVKVLFQKGTSGVVASDVISDITTNGYVSSYSTQLPFSRIQTVVRGVGLANVDGSLKLGVARDNPNNIEDYIDMNAGTGTGAINVFKPINSTGSPGLALTTTGAGNITLSPNTAVSGSVVANVGGVAPLSGSFQVSQSGAGIGGTTMPLARYINLDSTSTALAPIPVSMEFYKQKNLQQNEIMSEINFYGNDNIGDKVQFGAIKCVATNVVNGNEDGSIDIWSCVNGTPAQVFRFNGADNENNSFRPLDMNGNAITTATGTLSLTTTSTATDITLQPRLDQDIVLTTTGVSGNISSSASSGGNSCSQNITYNSHAIQTNGTITHRTTGSGLLALQAQGTGGISIDARNGGGTGNITTTGNIAVSTYNITGINQLGITNPSASLGLDGQCLMSGGSGAGAKYVYTMPLTTNGTIGTISVDNITNTDILGNVPIGLTSGFFTKSPINKYEVVISGGFTDVNDIVFLQMGLTNGLMGSSIVAGNTFSIGITPYVVENITASGAYYTTYTIKDTFNMGAGVDTLSVGGNAYVYLYARTASGSHTINTSYYNVSLVPVSQ